MSSAVPPYLKKSSPDFLKYGLSLYLSVLLFFTPFIITFLWGNHDWGWVKEGTPLLSGVFEGRFSQFILQTILFSGHILPIITLCTALFFFTLAALMLLDLWQVPPKKAWILLLSLFLITSPYTLSWLYFAFIVLSNLAWPLVIVLAFKLLDAKPTPLKFTFAVILFTLALGGYPPVINMIGVIFFSTALTSLCFDKLSPLAVIKKHTPAAIAAGLSVLLLLFIQYLLKKYGLQQDTYNTANISLTNIPAKLALSLTAAFKQFITTTSFITAFYKTAALLLCLAAVIKLYQTLPRRFYNKLVFIFLILGMLFSSVITTFLSENTGYVLYEPRIEFYGLLHIYLFSAAALFKTNDKSIKNLTFFSLILLLWYNFTTICLASKIWNFGMTAETNLANRFISRLEQTKNFTPAPSQYTFIQSGTLSLRPKYYPLSHTQKNDSYTLTAPYIPWHLPTKAYMFYYPAPFIAQDFDVYWSFIPPNAVPQTAGFYYYITKTAAPWPHQDAVYLDKNHIILTLTPDGNERAKHWLNYNF